MLGTLALRGTTPATVLSFWFGELTAGFADEAHRSRWFEGGDAFDAECRERFEPAVRAALGDELEAWLATPHGALAFILLCDQLPRTLYRGTARAFAGDQRALGAARAGVQRRLDRGLTFDERAFFYLPFEHSEDLVDQHTSVGLFSELRDATPQGYRHLTGAYLRHAHQHRDTVLRFGRFPHRNEALGRASSATEQAYLEAGG